MTPIESKRERPPLWWIVAVVPYALLIAVLRPVARRWGPMARLFKRLGEGYE